MPSALTDAVREQRYAKLRARKKQLERYYNVLGWIVMFCMGGGLIMAAFSSLLVGMFLDPMEIVRFLPEAGQAICVILAVYKHDPKFTGLMMLVFWGCSGMSALFAVGQSGMSGIGFAFNFAFLLLILCLIVDFKWQKLSREEGFPHFDITYEEREKRSQIQDELARSRALKAGVRITATEQTAEMGDLLDAGANTPVMAPHLHGSHDRGQFAVGGIQRPQEYAPGMMDALEEIGAPAPQSKPDAEMEEL